MEAWAIISDAEGSPAGAEGSSDAALREGVARPCWKGETIRKATEAAERIGKRIVPAVDGVQKNRWPRPRS